MPDTKEVTKLEGIVEEALPGATFRIRLDDSKGDEPLVVGHLSGKMRMHRIKVIPGDRVVMEFTPYDKERGRITRRL